MTKECVLHGDRCLDFFCFNKLAWAWAFRDMCNTCIGLYVEKHDRNTFLCECSWIQQLLITPSHSHLGKPCPWCVFNYENENNILLNSNTHILLCTYTWYTHPSEYTTLGQKLDYFPAHLNIISREIISYPAKSSHIPRNQSEMCSHWNIHLLPPPTAICMYVCVCIFLYACSCLLLQLQCVCMYICCMYTQLSPPPTCTHAYIHEFMYVCASSSNCNMPACFFILYVYIRTMYTHKKMCTVYHHTCVYVYMQKKSLPEMKRPFVEYPQVRYVTTYMYIYIYIYDM